jgi:hypothetical protein
VKSLSVWQRWSGSALIASICLVLVPIALDRDYSALLTWVALAGLGAYAASSCWWSIASARSPGGLLRRLLFIWVPMVIPAAWITATVEAAKRHDYEAMAVFVEAPFSAVVVFGCLLATVMALLLALPRADQPR